MSSRQRGSRTLASASPKGSHQLRQNDATDSVGIRHGKAGFKRLPTKNFLRYLVPVFDVSFSELFVLGVVALLVLGPDKLPGTLRTAGSWIARARRLMTDIQVQSGLAQLQTTYLNPSRSHTTGESSSSSDPTGGPRASFTSDEREYPIEGPDAYGALPEDVLLPSPELGEQNPGLSGTSAAKSESSP